MVRRHVVFGMLLGGTCLTSPLLAQQTLDTPPPTNFQVDSNNVDHISGSVVFPVTELSIGPSGPGGLSLINYHNGNKALGGPSGINWMMGVFQSGTTFRVSTGNGESVPFTQSGSSYTSQLGDGSTLTSSGSGTAAVYTYTAPNGTVIVYQYAGLSTYDSPVARAFKIVYPTGETVILHYAQASFTSTTSASSTAATSASAQPAGTGQNVYSVRIQSITSSSGYQLRFVYQGNASGSFSSIGAWNTLVSVSAINTTLDYCDPTGSSCVTSSQTPPMVSYSGNAVTDPVGNVTTYGYPANGFTVQRPGSSNVNDSYTLDGNGRPTQAIVNGVTSRYGFSASGNVLTVTMTDPLNGQQTTTADTSIGQILSYTDALNRTTSYSYTAGGFLSSVSLPAGNKVTYTRDGRGNATKTVFADASSNPVVTTSASYPASCTNILTCNKPISTTDGKNNTTTYAYDPNHGGTTSVTLPAVSVNGTTVSSVQTFSYVQMQATLRTSSGTQASGSPTYVLASSSMCRTSANCANGADETRVVYTGYDNNLRPTVFQKGGGDAFSTNNSAAIAASRFAYDAIGNITARTDPNGHTSNFQYDADNHLTMAAAPDPGSGSRKAIVYGYAPDGQISLIGSGVSTSGGFTYRHNAATSYDANGRKVMTALRSGDNNTTYSVVQYSYDPDGRLACTAVRMNPVSFASQSDACTLTTSGSFGSDQIKRNGYDAANEITTVTSGYGTSIASSVQASYTANGKVSTVTDPNGNVTKIGYDGVDRVIQTTFADAFSGNVINSNDYEQYSYDGNGNVTTKILRAAAGATSHAAIAYGYDALNRLTSESLPTGTSNANPIYGYDLLGNLLSATNSNGSFSTATSFTWDALSRKLSETASFNGAGSATKSFTYDIGGRRTRMAWSDGLAITYQYDGADQMTAIQTNGSTLVGFGYDDEGRRTSKSNANGTSVSYGYDADSRLATLSFNGGNSTNTITLGAYSPANQIGTRAQSNDAYTWNAVAATNRNYVPNNLNQYGSIMGTSQTYDMKGNMTSGTNATFAFNAENQLSGQTPSASGSTTSVFRQDALKRLIYAQLNGVRFDYDDSNLVTIYDNSNNLVRRYVFGPNGDEAVVWFEGTGTSDARYMDADERGSITRVSNSAGSLMRANTYDDFGIPGAANLGRFQYTGQVWLSELSMYNYKARIYSPYLGRFMQTDPIGYGNGPNWYNYVGSDPVNRTDPNGLYDEGLSTVEDGGGGGGDAGIAPPIIVNGDRPQAASLGTGDLSYAHPGFSGGGGGSRAPVPEIVVNANKPKKHSCSGPRLTLGGGVSGTVFAAVFGASAGLGGSISLPSSSLANHSLRGINFTGSLSLTPLAGVGAFLGAGKSFSGGVNSTNNFTIGGQNANLTITPGIQAGVGDEEGVEIQNSFANPFSLSGAAGRIAAGIYAAVGAQFSGNLSTGNIGC